MKRYLVMRVTDKATYASSKAVMNPDSALRTLVKLRIARPGTDYRLAELTIPDVAPFSDFWPVGLKPSEASKDADA